MTSLDVTPDSADVSVSEDGAGAGDGSRDWLAGRVIGRVDVAIAVAMGALVVAIAYVFRSIVVPTDPWHYVMSAMHFPSKEWVPLGYTRYGIVLASLPPARLLGNAQISYYFWPLLSAGVLATTVALLARRFWGWTAAVVALALLFSNRIMFFNLSRGYPDLMSVALFSLAVLVALIARDRLFLHRRAAPWLLAVGFLLGWSFEVRESSIVAWPLIALILWRRGSVLRSLALVSLPVFLWALLDVGISGLFYGDPLLKLHVLSGLGGKPSGEVTTASIANHSWYVGQSRWFYLTFVPKAALKTGGGIWMVAVGAVALLGLAVRNWPVRLMSVWFAGVYLLTVLPTGLLDPSRPRARIDVERYWIPFFPASALAVGGLVAVLAGWVAGWLATHGPLRQKSVAWRAVPAAALAVLVCWGPVAYGAGYATSSPAFAPNGGAALEDLRDHLRGRSFAAPRVWTDWETARILPAYQRDFFGGDKVWSGKPQSLTGTRLEPQPGDYVLLFSASSQTCTFCRMALGPWLKEHPQGPPASWQTEYVSDMKNLVLYRVG
jgi:hypothetical protein